MGTYTSRHLFAKMCLLSISIFGVESSWAPDVVCTFAPPKAWNVRPGTGNSSLLSVSFGWEWRYIEHHWTSETVKPSSKRFGMAMGLPSSAHWPVRSFVALFTRKHGTLDEHCKHQSCDRDCWAYHNMLGTSNQLSLSARFPQCKNYPYTCTTSTFAGFLGARNTGHICMCLYVSDIMFFWEQISSHLLRLPFFAGSLLWFEMIWTWFNFGPKMPLECTLWYDQKCAAGRLFCPHDMVGIKLGSPQSWTA